MISEIHAFLKFAGPNFFSFTEGICGTRFELIVERSCTVTRIYSLTIQRELDKICAVSIFFSFFICRHAKNTDAHIASLSKPYYIHLLGMELTRSTYGRGDAAGCRTRLPQGGIWCQDCVGMDSIRRTLLQSWKNVDTTRKRRAPKYY